MLPNNGTLSFNSRVTNDPPLSDPLWVKLNTNNNTFKTGLNTVIPKFSLTQDKKYVLSAWVKVGTGCVPGVINNSIKLYFKTTATQAKTEVSPIVLNPNGVIIEGWQRYEAVIEVPASKPFVEIELGSTTTQSVYFDDIRLHPYNANMKSFVYDPVSLRLMSELDENNYASFYEYDNDGTLVRVKKETERGIKTITETRSALHKLPIID